MIPSSAEATAQPVLGQLAPGRCPTDHFATGNFIVNFHGIGTPDRALDDGEREYWLTPEAYTGMLDVIVRHPLRDRIGITFDDGNRSDLEIGLPALRERGLTAQFFVLAGKLGDKAYLNRRDINELAAQGMEIGTHGLDHVRWDLLDPGALAREIGGSIQILEEATGVRIRSAGIPFGFYNRQVLRELRRRGIERVYSSDGGPRLSGGMPVPRFTVRCSMTIDRVAAAIEQGFRASSRYRTELRLLAKGLRTRH